jgi:hypothetical protein
MLTFLFILIVLIGSIEILFRPRFDTIILGLDKVLVLWYTNFKGDRDYIVFW